METDAASVFNLTRLYRIQTNLFLYGTGVPRFSPDQRWVLIFSFRIIPRAWGKCHSAQLGGSKRLASLIKSDNGYLI